MKFPILASVIIFVLVLTSSIKRHSRKEQSDIQSFWDREKAANSVRRKPIDHLDYITVSMEQFPTGLLAEDPEVAECIETLSELSGQRILNLPG